MNNANNNMVPYYLPYNAWNIQYYEPNSYGYNIYFVPLQNGWENGEFIPNTTELVETID